MSARRALAIAGLLIGQLLLGALGVLFARYERGLLVVFFGWLLLICVGFNLISLLGRWWLARNRPDPVIAAAPSGRSAVFFRRSPFAVVMGVVGGVALSVWCLATAVALYRSGLLLLALPVAAAAIALLWAMLLVGAGAVRSGGLWLAETGLEYRNEALSWAVDWSDIEAVSPQEPIMLVLRPGAQPAVHRSVRWSWNRDRRMPDGHLGINSAHLAGGPGLVSAMIEHYRTAPALRARLGTAESLPPPGMD